MLNTMNITLVFSFLINQHFTHSYGQVTCTSMVFSSVVVTSDTWELVILGLGTDDAGVTAGDAGSEYSVVKDHCQIIVIFLH